MELDHIFSSPLIHFGKIIHVFEIYLKYSTTLAFLLLNFDGFDKIVRDKKNIYIYGMKLCNLTSDPNECVIFFSNAPVVKNISFS